mgnify:FL=1
MTARVNRRHRIAPQGMTPWEAVLWHEWDVTDSGCWETRAGKTKDGYGRITCGGIEYRAHRLWFERSFGKLEDGEVVRHDCDNPPCINPGHLRRGTNLDNVADREARGRTRSASGEAHGNARLTEGVVAQIRAAIGTQRSIAAEYGVPQSTVSKIKNNKAWRKK